VIVDWNDVWERVLPVFILGWLLPAVLVACLALMAVLLLIYRVLVEQFSSRG
jgi:hypothetical protein